VHLTPHFPGRLRLLRVAMRRPRGASVSLLRTMLSDPDERIVRMAARELVRRRPPDMDQILIQLMTVAPESVRRVIGRSVGQVGFESFWNRFDRLDKVTRRNAGRAMFKVLPDALQRLERRLRGGPVDQRLKAMSIAQELGVAEALANVLLQACHDPAPKIRSKAVAVLATINVVPPEQLLDKVLNDNDPRVRANAIEVLEAKHRVEFVPMLAQRARTSSNRERANAIKALHRMKVGSTSQQLLSMIRDERSEHRLSALWALRQIGWWQLLNEVVGVAKADPSLKVRRYAMAVIRELADSVPGRNKEGSGVRVQGSGKASPPSVAPEPRKAAG
jgi:HEAT repeat protein